MMRIPEEILELYPQDPGTCPGRPWWKPHGTSALIRRDGLVFAPESGSNDHYADRDSMNPVPHPGFRVGQAWASVNPDGGVSATLIDAQSSGPDGEPAYGLAEDIGAGLSRGGNRIFCPTKVLLHRLEGCFLIADPCCPWLAPWAPCEESGVGRRKPSSMKT